MGVTGIFDALFVNHLFVKRPLSTLASGKTDLSTLASGKTETVFYPNGVMGRGYLVPPEREASLRVRLRWLVAVSLGTTFLLITLVRMIEGWLGYEVPLPWFIGGAAVVLVVAFVAIMHCLSRLTVGLAPFPTLD